MIDYEKLFCENVEKAAKKMINGKVDCVVSRNTLIVSISSNGFCRDYALTNDFSNRFANGTITPNEAAIDAIKNFKDYVNESIFKMPL